MRLESTLNRWGALLLGSLVVSVPSAAAAAPLAARCEVISEAGISVARLEVSNPTEAPIDFRARVVVQAGGDSWSSDYQAQSLGANESAEFVFRPFPAGKTIDSCEVEGEVITTDETEGTTASPIPSTGYERNIDSEEPPAAGLAVSGGPPAPSSEPPPASASEDPPAGSTAVVPTKGTIVEFSLGNQQTLLDEEILLPTVRGGIFLGYQSGRVTFGVGLDLIRLTYTYEFEGEGDSSSATRFMLMPGLRVSLARSHDRKVEILGQIDVGWGKWLYSEDGDRPSNYQLSYQLGPGLRYWAHPQLGFGAVAGLRGEFYNRSYENESTGTGITSVFSSLQLIGRF